MKTLDLLSLVRDSYAAAGSPESVLVALSGGADSVALMLLLKALREEGTLPHLEAVHVNHGLRENSAQEEKRVRLLCLEQDVLLHTVHVTVKSGNLEAQARAARYEAFETILQETGIRCLALAHHAGDVAETVLMRLIRGCGDGLSSIREISRAQGGYMLWRPLLSAVPEELKAYDAALKIAWCEDESNQDTSYTRNYIRHEVLRPLEERAGNVRRNIARSALILQDEQDHFTKLATSFLQCHAGRELIPWLDAEALAGLDKASRRAVIRTFTKPYVSELTFDETEAAQLLQHGGSINLRGGCRLERYGSKLYLTTAERPEKPSGEILFVPGGNNAVPDGKTMQRMPVSVAGRCELRFRRPGDKIMPFGMKEMKSLGDYLTDRKVPRPVRDRLPVMAMEDRVIWVIGVGCDEACRCDDTDETVLVTYQCPE